MTAICRTVSTAIVVVFLIVIPISHVNAGKISVMTINMYVGTDASKLTSARDVLGLVDAISNALQNISDSNPEARIEAVAREIAARDPALVSLQEVMLIKTSISGLNWDFLQLLLRDLDQLGKPYHTVATFQGLNLHSPSVASVQARLIDRTVIIARDSGLKLSNPQVGAFDEQLKVKIPLFGNITFTEGGATVDVETGGSRFRFVAAHLENVVNGDPTIQQAQAADLISRAADTTDLPVIMAGDFNANAANPDDASYETYKILRSGGSNGRFADAWTQINPDDPGNTCCRDPNLKGGNLTKRGDLVLYRRRHVLHATAASLASIEPGDRTAAGLWPSDHAAVEATFRIGGSRGSAQQ